MKKRKHVIVKKFHFTHIRFLRNRGKKTIQSCHFLKTSVKHHLFAKNRPKTLVFTEKRSVFFMKPKYFLIYFYETGLFHKNSEAVSQNTIWFHQVSLLKMTLFKLCLLIVIVKAKSLFNCLLATPAYLRRRTTEGGDQRPSSFARLRGINPNSGYPLPP